MGRRKIEIQPITRKNGLFKKAYELGVLCSVDVAVIIFEERPGHHVKLYQYGSTDIHDIVQRHTNHDGEKDTRGPPDFSGGAHIKMDDIGDGDDDDQDEDDDPPSRSRNLKRGPDGKSKPPQDIVDNMEYASGHRLSIPQPLSMHGLAPPPSGGSTLPISSMRDPSGTKRSRIGIPSSHSRSPSDDLPPPGSGPSSYSYHPTPTSGTFNRPSHSPYQHHPSQHHPSQHHSSQPHHHHQHHHTQQGQQQQPPHSNQYQPFFSVSSHTSPPPSFIPLQSEFSRSSAPSSRSGGTGSGGGPGFALPTRTNSSGSSYETGLYSNMIRGPSGGSSQSSGPGGAAGGGGGTGGGGGDLFAAFLDADEQRHQSQSSQSSGFPALDWPVHTAGAGGGGNASGNPGGGGVSGGGGSNAPSGPSTSSSSVQRRS